MIYDSPKEECGVFGIFDSDNAIHNAYLALHALQHRGVEAYGMVGIEDDKGYVMKHFGVVGGRKEQGVQDELLSLRGRSVLTHNRYSTNKSNSLESVQPFYSEKEGIAFCHNGNLINTEPIKEELNDVDFKTGSDSEVMFQLVVNSEGDLEDRVREASKKVKGGFAFLFLNKDKLIGVRDAVGIRPLVIGRLNGKYILTSETVVFPLLGAEFVREVNHGEMVVIDKDGLRSEQILETASDKARPCLFEYIYFSRPDSNIQGTNVYSFRKKCGHALAKEAPLDVDIVAPMPDSAIPAALGYSEASGIPFDFVITRNLNVGRSFIEPTQKRRDFVVQLKHGVNSELIKGKRLAMIDDSIVRGTTSRGVIKLMRELGAKEVHFLIASPPVKYPCHFGIDIGNPEELLARDKTVEEMREMLGADSLYFLSIDSIYKMLGEEKRNKDMPQFTDHYFTGDYSIDV